MGLLQLQGLANYTKYGTPFVPRLFGKKSNDIQVCRGVDRFPACLG